MEKEEMERNYQLHVEQLMEELRQHEENENSDDEYSENFEEYSDSELTQFTDAYSDNFDSISVSSVGSTKSFDSNAANGEEIVEIEENIQPQDLQYIDDVDWEFVELELE